LIHNIKEMAIYGKPMKIRSNDPEEVSKKKTQLREYIKKKEENKEWWKKFGNDHPNINVVVDKLWNFGFFKSVLSSYFLFISMVQLGKYRIDEEGNFGIDPYTQSIETDALLFVLLTQIQTLMLKVNSIQKQKDNAFKKIDTKPLLK